MERAEQGKIFPWFCTKSDDAVAMLKVEMKEHTQITTKVFFHEMDVVCVKTVRNRRTQIYAQFPFGRNIFNFALRTTKRSSEVMPTCAFILECWLRHFQD